MKVLKIIVALILFLLILGLVIPLFIDNQYAVEKTVTVDVDKKTAHNYLRDFTNHDEWSPWADIDPDMNVEFIGEMGTVGSMYKWQGNKEAGAGSMEITEITPDQISIQLHFKEPFESSSMTYYQFSKKNGKTDITWGMSGSMSYPMNIMLLFMDLEDAIGEDFEKGLNQLKKKLEERSNKKFSVVETVLPEQTYVGVREEIEFSALQDFYSKHLPGVFQKAMENNLQIAGAASGLYFEWDEENQKTDIAVAIPVADTEPEIDGYDYWPLGGRAVMIEYYGDYAYIGEAHGAIHEYLHANQLNTKSPAIQAYITDPETEPDTSKWQTNIYYLIE